MVEETSGEIIEATGDAVIIAEALHAIAEALSKIAKEIKISNNEEYGEPLESPTYMDGKPIER